MSLSDINPVLQYNFTGESKCILSVEYIEKILFCTISIDPLSISFYHYVKGS